MNLDPKVTQAIQNWLDTPEKDRDILAGANLLFSLNRNRALYNTIVRRPEKFLPKLVHELKKFLRIRLDNKTVSDIIRMENIVIPSVKAIVDETPVLSVDDELPEAAVARGRRADHDLLPEEIRELWESNADRAQKIRLVFNELKAMNDAQPCDRYEKLVILEELDSTYRSNLEKYDSYVISAVIPADEQPVEEKPEGDDIPDVATDNEKTINNARKTLSKYRKMIADMDPEDPKRQSALEKIQASVDAIYAADAGVADDTKAELIGLGISFDL